MSKPISVGPFAGIDNVHAADAATFQIIGELEKRRMALVAATDVDLDDDGWPSSRAPTVVVSALSAGLGGWSVGGRFFYQDGDTLYERTTTATSLLTGLNGRAMLCEHWGRIFVTDGAHHWEIDDTTVRTWGLPVPTVTLGAATGNLVPGTYLVQVSFSDARGNEGGTSDIASATLTTATGIEVTVGGLSPDCAVANIYVSRRDQKHTSFLTTVALGDLPYTIQHDDVSIADPPKTLQMTGPVEGAAGVFSFRAFLLMWRDGVVFRSEAAEPHLFHGENLMQFGGTVTACEGTAGEGVSGGMWIGTDRGLWWVQGEDPDKWIPVRKTFDPVARGSSKIQGQKVPRLQTDELVAQFVTSSGFVVGTASGQAVHLTDGVYRFDASSRASFAYSERDPLRQIMINLVN